MPPSVTSHGQGPNPVAPNPHERLDDLVHSHISDAYMGLSPIALALAQADWLWHLAASPGRQMQLALRALELGAEVWQQSFTPPGAGADAAPEKDPRFADDVWSQWPYNLSKESFKATDSWWSDATDHIEGMSRHHAHLVSFFARQAVDAMAPSNWPLSNPTVLRAGIESGGQTWAKGIRQFADDLMAAQKAKTAQAEHEFQPLPYQVGEQVAVTPGKVVFRNRLIELIQYTPTTAKVHPEPLLIVPSCIMKYYILDLSPENSMVRYLVSQGFTVCIISWRNPDASDRDLGMQDYLQQGVMAAMAAVKASTKAPRIHSLGYCLGGTFLAIVAAALGGGQRRLQNAPTLHRRASDAYYQELPELATVSLLAAQTDFSEPGELGVFIDDDQLKTLRASMERSGYLSGRAMAGSFQFLNSRDLIWSRNTRRYLLGQDEVGNDMMSWNADVTRLPARMHSEYLSSLFLNNALAAGHYRVNGRGVALTDIKAPMFVVGTVRDHISPWRSVYKIHLFTETHITFVLAAGGHNAGIVSEPGRPRRSYQIGSVEPEHGWIDHETWLQTAATHEGSWWVGYRDWLKEHSSKPNSPPAIEPSSVLCDAPGEYVMVRYAD